MALIRDDQIVDDDFRSVADDEPLPAAGAVIVSLERWQRDRDALLARQAPLGVRLRSDQSPESIADDLDRLALVALEFPKFRDGRAYSHARILRERYGFRGEVRAVGDVLMEQLHFMLRTGFNAFDIEGPDPLAQVFGLVSADGRRPADRHQPAPPPGRGSHWPLKPPARVRPRPLAPTRAGRRADEPAYSRGRPNRKETPTETTSRSYSCPEPPGPSSPTSLNSWYSM
jgi:uncharacterized protein (DUF934 family)